MYSTLSELVDSPRRDIVPLPNTAIMSFKSHSLVYEYFLIKLKVVNIHG